MKKIKLPHNEFTLVDDVDFEWLNQWSWFVGAKGYVMGRPNGRQVYMHSFIMNTSSGNRTDHKNHNRLDNQRKNLRICTASQNGFNALKSKRNSSGYKGVSEQNKGGTKPWKAYLNYLGKRIHLGYYRTAEEASKVRDEAALKYHKEFMA